MVLGGAGGREAGTGWWNGGVGVGNGREMGVLQIEQDGGLFSLGGTGSSGDQQCRTDFCAPKDARDIFNLTTSVDSGFLFDAFSRTQGEDSLALGGAGGREAGTGWWNGGVGVGKEHGIGMPQIE